MSKAVGNENPNKVDVLVFGAHPDDVELGTGGLLLKLNDQGYKTAIVDMVEGEMASGGTAAERYDEAEEARKILGVDFRENLKLPDCGVEDTFENRCKAAALIRKYQPNLIFSPFYEAHPPGRGQGHNDHYKTGQIISNAHNFAHLKNLPIEGETWFATAIYYYSFPSTLQPTFVVDFTPYFEKYVESIKAHKSQFGMLFDNIEEATKIMGPAFFEMNSRRLINE